MRLMTRAADAAGVETFAGGALVAPRCAYTLYLREGQSALEGWLSPLTRCEWKRSLGN